MSIECKYQVLIYLLQQIWKSNWLNLLLSFDALFHTWTLFEFYYVFIDYLSLIVWKHFGDFQVYIIYEKPYFIGSIIIISIVCEIKVLNDLKKRLQIVFVWIQVFIICLCRRQYAPGVGNKNLTEQQLSLLVPGD